VIDEQRRPAKAGEALGSKSPSLLYRGWPGLPDGVNLEIRLRHKRQWSAIKFDAIAGGGATEQFKPSIVGKRAHRMVSFRDSPNELRRGEFSLFLRPCQT
jgi:hypothetical protein